MSWITRLYPFQGASGNYAPGATSLAINLVGNGVGLGSVMNPMLPDGITDGSNTIQGVRSYDSAIGSWTTPDAFAGEVGDPMSQKSYMWNRNNPVTYSDPSGFDPFFIIPTTWALAAYNWVMSHQAINWQHQIFIDTTSSASLRSNITNDKLYNIANNLYRPGIPQQVAGGTAGAIKEEIATGQQVGGTFHLVKGAQSMRGLQTLMKSGELNSQDLQTASKMFKALEDAFGKVDWKQYLENAPNGGAPPPQ